MREMINEAKTELGARGAAAIIAAYERLRGEMLALITESGLDELRSEFERLFPPAVSAPGDIRGFPTRAADASLKTAMMHGWIQGLIEEQLLDQTIRAEAEAKVRLEGRPPTGFAPPD